LRWVSTLWLGDLWAAFPHDKQLENKKYICRDRDSLMPRKTTEGLDAGTTGDHSRYMKGVVHGILVWHIKFFI